MKKKTPNIKIIPRGTYNVKIEECKNIGNQYGKWLALDFMIMDGPEQGKVVREKIKC